MYALSAIFAATILSVALVQASLLAYQDRNLKRGRLNLFVLGLPPLLKMESVLFRSLVFGFLALTAMVVCNYSARDALELKDLADPLSIGLSLAAWLIVGVLLLGHWRLGWRGCTARRLTVLGYLAMIGSLLPLDRW